jgi:hypothetical protein
MNTEAPSKVLPPERPIPYGKEPQPTPRSRLSRRRLALAFTLAALADGFSVFLTLTPPLQWATDLVTAILLFIALGKILEESKEKSVNQPLPQPRRKR